MATSSKIRVGIVGASASRGFASIAHIPALQALPGFEIAAVCTARQESAEAAAAPKECPYCRSTRITAPTDANASTYWRCDGCGEMWNVSRQRASVRYPQWNRSYSR